MRPLTPASGEFHQTHKRSVPVIMFHLEGFSAPAHRRRLVRTHNFKELSLGAEQLPGAVVQPLQFSANNSRSYIASISDVLFWPEPPGLHKHELSYRCFDDKQQNAYR